MRIQFCGADRTVTGSSHLIEINGLRLFLDMGFYQGPRDQARQINQHFPADLRADAIILSHGHLDHCGRLPMVIRRGFAGPIYCTPATAAVTEVVLNDSAAIQLEDVQYLNQRTRPPGEPQVQPLYTPADVPPVLKRFKTIAYGRKTDLGKGVSFTFFDAGHILGSAWILLEWTEAGRQRTLLFTGDVGRYDTPILRDPAAPTGPVETILTESTYGDRLHGPMSEVGPQLLAAVQDVIAKHSRLLVPSFALGRTQTILWYMQRFIQAKQIPEIPIFIDSPMGVKITEIHSQFRDNYDAETLASIGTKDLFAASHVTLATSVEQSKQINSQQGACVIIASSPTCEFGRIVHHLTQSVERPADRVVFVGYIPPSTLGRRLQDGEKRVRMLDRWYDVRCQVETIHGLSAHADYDELLRFLKPAIGPNTSAYVVHGEADSAEALAARLLTAGVKYVQVPAMDTSAIDGQIAATPAKSATDSLTPQQTRSEVGE